jgi:hypothetical protein
VVVKSTDTRFVAFKDIVRIDYKGKLVRFINCFQQNMIKIEVEESETAFNLSHHLEQWLAEAQAFQVTYKSLEVKALLPVNCAPGIDGFIDFRLLSKCNTDLPEYMSEDGQCVLRRKSLQDLRSKFNSQWSHPTTGAMTPFDALVKVCYFFFYPSEDLISTLPSFLF